MSRIQKLENIYKKPLENKNIKDVSNFIHSIVYVDVTKGKYARFLLDAFLNDKFLEEDLIGGLESTVGQAISLFHKHKHKLPEDMRSIFKYSSPGDLWKAVKQFQGELSGKELKKEEQEKIYRETEFIYKDETTGFQVVSPLTEESAKWWGKGTRWCTSADNDNMFLSYTAISSLLILLIPARVGTSGNIDKLQLWKNGKNIQFMNEADNNVDLNYIEQNWDILEPICLWLNDLQYIPEKYRTEEICELAVKNNGDSLCYVPDNLKTKKICNLAIMNSNLAIDSTPMELLTEEYLKELIIAKQKGFISCLPKSLKTQELYEFTFINKKCDYFHIPNEYKNTLFYKNIIYNFPLFLKDLSKELKTKELCELAFKQNHLALQYFPEEFITQELCEIAIHTHGNLLRFIKLNNRTEELCKIAVQQNGIALQFVPEHLKTEELCELAMKIDGLSLQYFPKHLITFELYKKSVNNNPFAIHFIPPKFITQELCEIAVKKNELALRCIPEKYITYEMCLSIKDENVIRAIPKHLKTEELYTNIVKNNGLALRCIPNRFITQELCELAYKQNHLALQYFPKTLKEKKENVLEYERLQDFFIKNILDNNHIIC